MNLLKDMDECEEDMANCHKDRAFCFNTEGSYVCSCIEPYWVGNGTVCNGMPSSNFYNVLHNSLLPKNLYSDLQNSF